MTLEIIENLFNINSIQAQLIAFAAVLFLAFITYQIFKNIILKIILKISKKTRTNWDDALVDRKFFRTFLYLLPLLIFYYSSPLFPQIKIFIQKITQCLMVIVAISAISSFLNAVNDIYLGYKKTKNRPIKGYLQIIQIFFIVLGCVAIISILIGKSPLLLLSGLGAMTAVLLLIFKDTILSLIASLQISFNDLIKIGDWLEVPLFGADGVVIDVALHTIKIQNWDKTITTIPTHKLIDGSFKNWKGMQQTGGRRVKRAIHLDISSIRFCDDNLLDKFEKINLISEYIKQKRKEIYEYESNIKTSELQEINRKKLTNVGTFRAYVAAYLKNHPKVKNEMTFLIRQLSPAPTGLPIEIYVFINDIEWANYEAVQSDIFDHILAVVPEFDLRIFQYPSGFDFRKIDI